MKQILKGVMLASFVCALLGTGFREVVKAEVSQNTPSLIISQIKITSSNGQLIVLYNTTDRVLDMSKYQLEYFNSYDFTKATSSRLIALEGSLPPHSHYMISDDTLSLCHSAVISSVSLGLSSTAGFVEVMELSQALPGGLVSRTIQDYVGWSKTAVIGAQTLPTNTAASLLRQPLDQNNKPDISVPGGGSWLQIKPDLNKVCGFVANSSTSLPVEYAPGELLPASEPPFSIEYEAADTMTGSQTLVEKNPGLMKPLITEMLPNPMGTGNDAKDEFIEIYNPNPTTFDLSGFRLEAGSSTIRSYVFPEGTKLAPLSFTPFYSSTTKLSLSNTLSQASLLDPFDRLVADTEPYSSAKDGQTWVLANGAWSWSMTPTPGRANILHAPPKKTTAKKAAAKSGSKSKATSKDKNSNGVLGAKSQNGFEMPEEKTPIHNWTLALVGGLALLYAGYEYRADIGNKIFELRRNFGHWRKARPQA